MPAGLLIYQLNRKGRRKHPPRCFGNSKAFPTTSLTEQFYFMLCYLKVKCHPVGSQPHAFPQSFRVRL